MKFEISKELLDKIANYLATRPWVEVHVMLSEMHQIKRIEEVVEDKKD